MSTNDRETLSYQASRAEDYYLRVFLASDSGTIPGNSYDLSTTVSAQACNTDQYDPNDTISAASMMRSGTHSNLWVCTSDADYFAFSAVAGDILSFNLSYLNNEGELEARILDSNGNQLATSLSSGSGTAVSYMAAAAGTYYLHVALILDSGTVLGNGYTLDARVGSSSGTCATDALEPNDTRATAAMISRGTYNNRYSCNTSDESYAVDVRAGDNISINVDFLHSAGDIDRRLYDPGSFSAVAESVTFMAPEVITAYQASTAGIYIIKITQYLDAGRMPGNTYSMTLSY